MVASAAYFGAYVHLRSNGIDTSIMTENDVWDMTSQSAYSAAYDAAATSTFRWANT